MSDRLVGMEVGCSALVPALAESWPVSGDGLIYTFMLRRGVKWQSNAAFKPVREFNADDVVLTFNRMADKALPYHGVDSAYPEFQEPRSARKGEAEVAMLGGIWNYPDPSQLLLA